MEKVKGYNAASSKVVCTILRKWTLVLTYSVTVQTPKLTRRGKLPRKTFVNPVEFITNLGVKCKITLNMVYNGHREMGLVLAGR